MQFTLPALQARSSEPRDVALHSFDHGMNTFNTVDVCSNVLGKALKRHGILREGLVILTKVVPPFNVFN